MKIKMKIRMKKTITFMLTMFILTAALPVNIQAKSVTTPVSQLPEKSDVGQITVTVNSENGTRKYTIFGQHKNPWKKTKYLDMHGCAVSSLTAVLSAYSKKYRNYTPVQVKNIVEKKALGTAAWKRNYSKPVLRQMPRTTRRWALGKHTMVLLGLTDDGRVIVADSAQRTWSKKKQRIKYTTVKEIVKYLIPCKSSARTYYFSSTAASGGYVLVNTK